MKLANAAKYIMMGLNFHSIRRKFRPVHTVYPVNIILRKISGKQTVFSSPA